MDNNIRRVKTDRIARLMVVLSLLYNNSQGIQVTEIARKCNVTTRTTRNDTKALEVVGFPIWRGHGKRGLDFEQIGEYYLPIIITIPEALTIFLAARLSLHHEHRYDPNIINTFMKLSTIVPCNLSNQIHQTITWMKKQRKDDRYLWNLQKITEAWISNRKVKISYKALRSDEAHERIIEPYFIEPASNAL